jgi:hypothetical protein
MCWEKTENGKPKLELPDPDALAAVHGLEKELDTCRLKRIPQFGDGLSPGWPGFIFIAIDG